MRICLRATTTSLNAGFLCSLAAYERSLRNDIEGFIEIEIEMMMMMIIIIIIVIIITIVIVIVIVIIIIVIIIIIIRLSHCGKIFCPFDLFLAVQETGKFWWNKCKTQDLCNICHISDPVAPQCSVNVMNGALWSLLVGMRVLIRFCGWVYVMWWVVLWHALGSDM